MHRTTTLLEELVAVLGDDHHIGGPLRIPIESAGVDQAALNHVVDDVTNDFVTLLAVKLALRLLAVDLLTNNQVYELALKVLLAIGAHDERSAGMHPPVELDQHVTRDHHHALLGLARLLLRLALSLVRGRAPRGGLRPVVGVKGRDCAHFYLAFLCVCVCTTHLDGWLRISLSAFTAFVFYIIVDKRCQTLCYLVFSHPLLHHM